MHTLLSSNNYPQNCPQKMNGKLAYKIIIKKDYVRKDGTCALYLQIFINKERKRIPLNIFVRPKEFDDIKQTVKGNSQRVKDINLIINKKKANINDIEISYRLTGIPLTMKKLIEDLENPSAKFDFIPFYKRELEKQKNILAKATFRQQKSTLTKIKKFKSQILFQDITEDFLKELIAYCRKKLKNQDNTINSTVKNFKKYLHIANKRGIKTPLNYKDIHLKSFASDRCFLTGDEIKKLDTYRNSTLISDENRNILDRFLFSCFTGLRISDVQEIKRENISDGVIYFSAVKTKKVQKIRLNNAAKKFINDRGTIFNSKYSDVHINRQLKVIARACSIKKRVSFHVARHTFATNYLIRGGRVENLQKALGHSSIRETMIYVHIVEELMNDEISNLDSILT